MVVLGWLVGLLCGLDCRVAIDWWFWVLICYSFWFWCSGFVFFVYCVWCSIVLSSSWFAGGFCLVGGLLWLVGWWCGFDCW